MSPDFVRPRLNRLSVLWLSTLVVVLVACTAASTGTPLPGATASGAAASSSTGVVFTSTRYRYSITLPIGWVATPASATWGGTTAPIFDDPVVDAFGPAGEVKAFGSAAPTTSLLAAWVADGIRINFLLHGDVCPQTPDSTEPVTIGGQPGTFVDLKCDVAFRGMAFTVVNGYGYRFAFRDPANRAVTDPADKATFTTLLGSVVFH